MNQEKAKLVMLVGIGVAAAIVLLSSTLYSINYGTIGVVTRFGQIVGSDRKSVV